MMLRTMAGMAVCLVMMLPAAAQQSVIATDPAARDAALELFPTDVADEPLNAPTLDASQQPVALHVRAGAVATTVFRVLASQNRLKLGAPDDQMDAYLRPPSGEGHASVFRQAKSLYDEATTYRTDRYDLSLDPLNLTWRLKLRLSRYLTAGSR